MRNYYDEIKITEKKLVTLKQKQKKLISDIKKINKNDYNQTEDFKNGDVILFNGHGLHIAIVKEKIMINGKRTYDIIGSSMNFNHSVVRKATKDEIKMLGDKKLLTLKEI